MIFFGDFGGVSVAIRSETPTAFAPSPSTATASYSLQSDGQIVFTGMSGSQFWITPQSGMSGYEARATVTSGSLTSGPVGSWVSLGSDQTWVLESTFGFEQAEFVLQIRMTSGATVASATITLFAEVI